MGQRTRLASWDKDVSLVLGASPAKKRNRTWALCRSEQVSACSNKLSHVLGASSASKRNRTWTVSRHDQVGAHSNKMSHVLGASSATKQNSWEVTRTMRSLSVD
eukprot:1156835-Pelagomonas_calceolata.AAC.9